MGFDWGGASSGAAGGAMMGAKTGNPYVAAGGAVLGGLMGGFGKKKDKGGLQEIWPQWKFNPGAEAGYRSAWGNIQNQQEALSRGELPSYFQRYQQSARKAMADPLYRTYFGSGGSQGAGVLNRNFEAASLAGANPKAATRAMSKGLYDYSNQVQQIDQTMNEMGFNWMNSAMDNAKWAGSPGNAGEWQTPTYLDTRQPGSDPGGQLLDMGIGSGGIGSLSGLFKGGGAKGGVGSAVNSMGINAGMSRAGSNGGWGNINVPPQYR